MKPTALVYLLFFYLLFNGNASGQERFSREERAVLKAAAGIQAVFQHHATDIWPGYDLSRQPYLLYLPDRWALLLNASGPLEGFREYPADWPELGCRAFFFPGKYDQLVGQFEFHFKIDTVESFAMGAPLELLRAQERPAVYLFRTTIHEGFHQYQFDHFGEIPWAREERYPLLDAENNALAALEMQLLMEALRMAYRGDVSARDRALRQFVAVRSYRWQQADPFVKRYEQGQEINEGTARYVEMKSVEMFLQLDTGKTANPLVQELREDFQGISRPDFLLEDFRKFLSGKAVSPEDMARHRIYPVGAALGFLLDRLGVEWKPQFQATGDTVTFLGMLQNYFQPQEEQLAVWRRQAQEEYDYPEILAQARNLVADYRTEFLRYKTAFERQAGFRVEIELSSNGLRRFRSTKTKTFLLEKGSKLLCPHYILYALQNNKLRLELHDRALYEENDWEKRQKKVVFYLPEITLLEVDGQRRTLTAAISRKFDSLEIQGEGVLFRTEQGGRIRFAGKTIRIILNR